MEHAVQSTTNHHRRHGDATTVHADGHPQRADGRAWLGLAALMLPVLLVSIDNTVLSFALPAISRSLQPSGSQLLWMVDIYPLVLAGLLVTMGTLGDRIGRRRLLLIGATGFSIVSVYAAFSPIPEHLIAARALQGLFGATLMPSTLALLRNLFPDHTQRRLAIAIWASGFSAGAALGPILGGWLLEHYWWGSVFLVNVPVLMVMLVAAPFLVPESRDPAPGRLDPVSVVLAIAGMLVFVYGIKSIASSAPIASSSGATGALIMAAGAMVIAWFVRRQIRAPNPLLDMRLFTIPAFSASVVANLMSVLALTGMLFFVSQYLQLVLDMSPMISALYLLPGLVATVVMGLAAVALVRFFSIRTLIPAGLVLATGGFALATQLGASTSVWLLVAAFTLVGAGVGLAQTLTNDAILASVPARRAGAAAGVSETAYEVGALLGTAVLGSVLTAVYRAQIVVPAPASVAQIDAASQTLGGALAVAETLDPPAAELLADSARQAFSHGADVTAFVGLLVVLSAAVLVAWTLRRQPARG